MKEELMDSFLAGFGGWEILQYKVTEDEKPATFKLQIQNTALDLVGSEAMTLCQKLTSAKSISVRLSPEMLNVILMAFIEGWHFSHNFEQDEEAEDAKGHDQ